MSTKISGRAASARESARKSDGKFGEQEHERSSVSLGGEMADSMSDADREALIQAAEYNVPTGHYYWYEMKTRRREAMAEMPEDQLALVSAALDAGASARVDAVIEHAAALRELGYEPRDIEHLSVHQTPWDLSPTAGHAIEHQIDAEHLRVIADRIEPALRHYFVGARWPQEAVFQTKDPSALADAVEGQPRKGIARYRAVATAEHPERAAIFDAAEKHGITRPEIIESGRDIDQIADIRDELGCNELQALHVHERGFDAEMAKGYGIRIADNPTAPTGEELRALEAQDIPRADLRSTIGAFRDHRSTEDVEALAKARPGLTHTQRKVYARIAEGTHISGEVLAEVMRTVTPEEVEAYGTYEFQHASVRTADAVRTLVDAGIPDRAALCERQQRVIEPRAEGGTSVAIVGMNLREAARTASIPEDRVRALSRAGVPMARMPEIPADADAWDAGEKFRQRKPGEFIGTSATSENPWPWTRETYQAGDGS